MHKQLLHPLLLCLLAVSLIAAACGDDAESSDEARPTEPGTEANEQPTAAPTETGADPSDDSADVDDGGDEAPAQRPPANPFLANSVVPIAHGDSAQSDWSPASGPHGEIRELTADELLYQHLGPAHFGIAISPAYPDGRRVIWSNGGDRISKLDYDTFEVLAELPLSDNLMAAETADDEIATLDATAGAERANTGLTMATTYLLGLSGIYYLLDRDNTLFVGGTDSILAYTDTDPSDPTSPIELRDEWTKPDEITGGFVGANLTFDGRIAMITNEGWIVLVERDFSGYDAIQMVGADAAPQHNQDMIDQGFRPGAGDWVRNSIATDEDGIYAVSADHMHKIVWDGERLSTDPADGAWSEPYLNSSGAGSGATPALMGFGDEDQFVVITDGETVMNVTLFWRNEVPEGWAPPESATSDRIAGQLAATIGDPARGSIQTEQSVVVAGYGAFVVNNDPASIPDGFAAAGNRVLVSYAGSDPAFTPHGLQKFEWDPETRSFGEAWVNTDVSSANAVPIVSADLGMVYTVGARDGKWTMEGVDWATGEAAFHWVTGSNRYNTLYSGINIDAEGRIVHTTMFGIVRYEPSGG